MRENGTTIKDTPKIHVNDPTPDDHAITIGDDLQIPLSLNGTFSFFGTRKPTATELVNSKKNYTLTPDNLNRHCDSFDHNESLLTNWEGNSVTPEPKERIVLSDVPSISVQSIVSEVETDRVNRYFLDTHERE